MIYPCKFSDIPSIISRDIVHTRICHADANTGNSSLRPAMTLKIGSESPKLNQLFGLSQWCIHESLIKFHPLIQEIRWIQTVTPTSRIRTETNTPPPHLWWGDIIMATLAGNINSPYLRLFFFFLNLLKSSMEPVPNLKTKQCCMHGWVYITNWSYNGWVDDLWFYFLFNSSSVISEWWADDNDRLCAMEHLLQLRRFCLEQGSNSGLLDNWSYKIFTQPQPWIPDLDFLHTREGYPRVSPVPTNLISPMLSHPGPDKNHVYLMHWLYRKS